MRFRVAAGLFLVLAAPSVEAIEYDYRAFESGDEWDYAFSATPPGEPPSMGFAKIRVEGFTQIGGERFVRVVRYEGCPPGDDPCDWGMAREFLSRASDLASSRVSQWEKRGTLVEMGGTEWSPPCDENAFPIQPLDRWTTDCKATNFGGEQAADESDYRMERVARAAEAVDTPLGSFDAIPVEIRDAGSGQMYETQWYSPEACGWVKTETLPPLRAGYLLRAYQCGERSGGTLRALAEDLEEARSPIPLSGTALVLAGLAAAAFARGKRS